MSDLTHELKSPIVKIKAIAAILIRNLVKKELTDKEIAEYLKRVDASADVLNDLIDKKVSL
ncbi:hypothetical protein A2872_00200 [Candidatus Gottesmanbacteria bacterium RIFCSPHIGHO2_01_FULL_42_12]|uniref:Signal transduction histidine kinase dimerisation/phosphoacceptor domain-containing protein n=1 Tax=Candidatus Gottesmanbacteria bacterium RIFCSPHIGHO2_01_FULL_42_12 TaxID=1798377 RepID=A0A1F5YZF2_9BACT|nr:MAG: hypothetical protein A2872_00200 [Candidatus Gottesmanbacteria bacterium RIFCSPHIGHO2_01_FULL_42_12]